MKPARPVRRLPHRVREALLALAATLAGLLLLEGAARVAWTLAVDARAEEAAGWLVRAPGLGWHPRPGFDGSVQGVHRRFDSRGYLALDSGQVGDTGATRIVFVGDSRTFGSGVSAESTFVEAVERSLPGVAAINLGVPGWTATQGYRALLSRGSELAPDLLVVSFGSTDRHPPAGEPAYGRSAPAETEHRRASAPLPVVGSTYLYRGLDALARRLRPREPALVDLDTLRPRTPPEEYESRLDSIAAWARERGAGVVFLSLPDNPVESEWLRVGLALLESERHEEAAEALRAAVAKQNGSSDLARLYLARAYRALGRFAEAEEAVRIAPAASPHGGRPIRLEEEYRAITERVAARHGTEVLDAGAVLAEAPSDYLDFAHPDANGHRRIGELLSERLAERLARLERPEAPRAVAAGRAAP